jgi:hypothetical protein
MQTEEEIESWYEENKHKALEKLLTALEKKENIDEAETLYTKDLKRIFEEYKKKMLRIATTPAMQREKSSNRVLDALRTLLSFTKIFRR